MALSLSRKGATPATATHRGTGLLFRAETDQNRPPKRTTSQAELDHLHQIRHMRTPRPHIADNAGTYALRNADLPAGRRLSDSTGNALRTPPLHIADNEGTFTLHNADLVRSGRRHTSLIADTAPPHCGVLDCPGLRTFEVPNTANPNDCGLHQSALRTPQTPAHSTTRIRRRARRPNLIADSWRTPRLRIADNAGTYTLRNADSSAGRGGTDSLRTRKPAP
ncbi:hypothetical protein CJEDD_11495 [Corynebacterium jeddahense]|uniref:Uncharacterized protein n=1 Tax=Corynebacterium jeddahense TaxID=1414719 RepID=A0ABY7UND5_9CORY|nr:hypothetical protein CJEDD_11495 [Corynebacterium jeddahense]